MRLVLRRPAWIAHSDWGSLPEAQPYALAAAADGLLGVQHAAHHPSPPAARPAARSDPGVWAKLVAALAAAAGPGTLIAQAETRRLEGRLYGEVTD